MKVFRWCSGVVISLVPIAFAYVALLNRGREGVMSLVAGRGELALIAVAMCAGGVVALFGAAAKKHPLLQGLAGLGALLVVLFASLYFADVSALVDAGAPPKPAFVASVSWWLFIVGFLCTLGCVILGEE